MALLDAKSAWENKDWLLSPLDNKIEMLNTAIKEIDQTNSNQVNTEKIDLVCLHARAAYRAYLGIIPAFTDTNDSTILAYARRAAENLMRALTTAHNRLARIQHEQGLDPQMFPHWRSVGAKIDSLRNHVRINFGFEL